MMIAKGLALVSVLWNLAGNSEAPFLDRQPARAGETRTAARAVTPAPEVTPAPDASADAQQEASPAAAPTPVVAASARPPATAASPQSAASPRPAASPEVAVAPSPEASPAAPKLPPGPQKGPVITAIHVTGWISQMPQRLAGLIENSKKGGLTAMVFEVKDVNGDLFFKMETADGTNRFAEAIKACHAAGLKVIARFCVFKDKAGEEKNPRMRYGGTPGTDRRHKPWTDPNSSATAEYNLGLIKELAAMGVDEVNLDYIRFPSAPEGVHIDLPLLDKCKSVASFVKRARALIPKPIRLSMDVFGYVAWDENSARVGQRLEDLAPHVDGIYPMLYPDHFAKGDLGYKHPVEHPYEVLRRGCEAARLKKGMDRVDVIPWLQAFSLSSDSITYGPTELLAQIQGAKDAGVPSWLAWNPRVNYADLDRALQMAKGKTDYALLVKRYIPKKYQVAAAAADEEDGEEDEPAAAAKPGKPARTAKGEKPETVGAPTAAASPAVAVAAAALRPTAAARQLENLPRVHKAGRMGIPPAAPPLHPSPASGADQATAGKPTSPAALASAATSGASSASAPAGSASAAGAGAGSAAATPPAATGTASSTSSANAGTTAASSGSAGAVAPSTEVKAVTPVANTTAGSAGTAVATSSTATPGTAVSSSSGVSAAPASGTSAAAASAAKLASVPSGASGASAPRAAGPSLTAATPSPAASPAIASAAIKTPDVYPSATGAHPEEAPISPFAAAATADSRSDSALLGAAPTSKPKSAKTSASTKAKSSKKPKKPAQLEELPDDSMDAQLYKYAPK